MACPAPVGNLRANLSQPVFKVGTLLVARYRVHWLSRQNAKQQSSGEATGQAAAR